MISVRSSNRVVTLIMRVLRDMTILRRLTAGYFFTTAFQTWFFAVARSEFISDEHRRCGSLNHERSPPLIAILHLRY